MPTVEHNGIRYEINEDGYLITFPKEIDLNWVDYVCSLEEINREITPEKNHAITKLRDYYIKHKAFPTIRNAKITVGRETDVYKLFGIGTISVVGKMAGYSERIC